MCADHKGELIIAEDIASLSETRDILQTKENQILEKLQTSKLSFQQKCELTSTKLSAISEATIHIATNNTIITHSTFRFKKGTESG